LKRYYTEDEFAQEFDYPEIWAMVDVLSFCITKEESEAIFEVKYKPFKFWKA